MTAVTMALPGITIERGTGWRGRDDGNVDAAAVLATQHLVAGSAEHDPDLALELLEKAVAAGLKLARVHLARAHLEAPKGDEAFGGELMMEHKCDGAIHRL